MSEEEEFDYCKEMLNLYKSSNYTAINVVDILHNVKLNKVIFLDFAEKVIETDDGKRVEIITKKHSKISEKDAEYMIAFMIVFKACFYCDAQSFKGHIIINDTHGYKFFATYRE